MQGGLTPEGLTPRPVFYYDLGSPYAYLAAERVNGLFAEAIGEAPVWQPILLGGLFKRFDRGSWAETEARQEGIAEVERRAAEYGLPSLRWPDRWPVNTLAAMRAATYAKSIGKGVSFALAGFRQAFAGGLDLSEPDNVCIAAAACEIHPRALLVAIRRRHGQSRADRCDRGRRGSRCHRSACARRRRRGLLGR